MAELINLEKLNGNVKKTIEPYCAQMVKLHEGNVKSVSVYGSASGEDFIPGKSNINILVVMERVDPPDLKKSLKLVASGRKKGIVAPLMLTMEHMSSSTDVFPMEFLEMKENYRLIFGEDVLGGLSINPANIRLQCEQQVKGGLIRLYQVYLEVGMKQKRIKELMVNSLGSLMPVFRNVLRLKGKDIPARKVDVIAAVCAEFPLKKELFLNILELKKGGKAGMGIETIFGDYIEELEKFGIEIDGMKV